MKSSASKIENKEQKSERAKGRILRISRVARSLSARLRLRAMINRRRIILDTPVGIEKISALKGAKIITANRFLEFDDLILERIFKLSPSGGKLCELKRDGILPTAPSCAHSKSACDAIEEQTAPYLAASEIFEVGNSLLIYPEPHGCYKNYNETNAAHRQALLSAAERSVPLIPVFTVVKSGGILAKDGAPVARYVPYICDPIYPDVSLSGEEAALDMEKRCIDAFRAVYEREYGIPLISGYDFSLTQRSREGRRYMRFTPCEGTV